MTDEDEQILASKIEWARSMRLKYCVRPQFPETSEMILENGMLNKDYFKSEKAVIKERKWTQQERDLLIQGIEKCGIGYFSEISDEFLPEWKPNDLRLKTMRLIGRQNLSAYKGWKGSAADIAAEYERNREIGLRTNCWRGGLLISDPGSAET